MGATSVGMTAGVDVWDGSVGGGASTAFSSQTPLRVSSAPTTGKSRPRWATRERTGAPSLRTHSFLQAFILEKTSNGNGRQPNRSSWSATRGQGSLGREALAKVKRVPEPAPLAKPVTEMASESRSRK